MLLEVFGQYKKEEVFIIAFSGTRLFSPLLIFSSGHDPPHTLPAVVQPSKAREAGLTSLFVCISFSSHSCQSSFSPKVHSLDMRTQRWRRKCLSHL